MERLDRSGTASNQRRYLTVAQSLLTSLAQGDFTTGDKLPGERELAVQHSVSRPTVRQALLALELVGAVDIRHGDGVLVRGTRAQVGMLGASALDLAPRELIESRQIMEPNVAELTAARITSVALRKLRTDAEEAASIASDTSQINRFMELGFQFHADVARNCGNDILATTVGQLVDTVRHPLWLLINQLAMVTSEARAGQATDHLRILEAIEKKDPRLVGELMKNHLCELEHSIFAPTGERADRGH